MSKPIKMTPDMIEECVAEFRAKLSSMQMFDGKIEYKTSYEYKKEKDENGKEIPDTVKVIFSEVAFAKQNRLVQDFSSEVAWNGIVRRDENDPKVFHIDDIIVFPQTVTGATVTPNQKEYEMWLMNLPDEQFNHCRYHGHSHVNMGTSPSGTDDSCQKQIIGRLCGDGFADDQKDEIMRQLGDSAFYIFMIWNKRGEHNVRIFDMYTNTFYEGKDVLIEVEGAHTYDDFMADAKAKVKAYTYTPYTSAQGAQKPAISQQKQTPALPGQIGFKDDDAAHRQYPYEYDDYDDYWRNYHRS